MDNFDLKKYLAEGRIHLKEGRDTLRSLIQDLIPVEYETFADNVGVDLEDGNEMEGWIDSISDEDVKMYIAQLKGVNEDMLKEEYKGTDLLAALKDLHKRLTAEKFDVAPLQKGRDFDKAITDKVGTDGSMLAAILMDNTKDNSGGTSAKIVVNVLALSKLDQIVKEMGLEDSKYTTGDKIAKSTQEPGSISISGKQKYPKGCYEITLHHAAAK